MAHKSYLKTFTFTLTRTRVQSAACTVTARTFEEAEDLVVNLIDGRPDSDQLRADADSGAAGAMTFGAWSDGEDEGALDYDMDLFAAYVTGRVHGEAKR